MGLFIFSGLYHGLNEYRHTEKWCSSFSAPHMSPSPGCALETLIYKKRMSAVLPELPGKPVTVETWHPEDLENSQFVHSMSILYAGIQVHRIYYACADHLIYCQGLLPGATRPAARSENVGFTARTQDICEHTQLPILQRLPRRKYRNHSQTSALALVPCLSADRDRLLG